MDGPMKVPCFHERTLLPKEILDLDRGHLPPALLRRGDALPAEKPILHFSKRLDVRAWPPRRIRS